MTMRLPLQSELWHAGRSSTGRDMIDLSPHKVHLTCTGSLVVGKPGAMPPVTTATIEALSCFGFSGLWPEIQATRFAGVR